MHRWLHVLLNKMSANVPSASVYRSVAHKVAFVDAHCVG